MGKKATLQCKIHGEVEAEHMSGWYWCMQCKPRRRLEPAHLKNTNRGRGEDRGYDASESAHGIKAKGSFGGANKKS